MKQRDKTRYHVCYRKNSVRFFCCRLKLCGVLVSVSAVRISPDMSIARVYLSIFPSEKSEEMVKNINNNMKSIRFELGTRVRHQLRIIPELKFFVDDSLDYIEKIDALLK